jgi:hypothetical protein
VPRGSQLARVTTRLPRLIGVSGALGLGVMAVLATASVAGAATTTVSVPQGQIHDLAVAVSGGSGTLPPAGSSVTWTYTVNDVGSVEVTGLSITSVVEPQGLGSDTAGDFIGPSGPSDALSGPVTCPATTLAPGASLTCKATEVIDPADVARGSLDEAAYVSGSVSGMTVDSHIAEGALQTATPPAAAPLATTSPTAVPAPTVVVHRATTSGHFLWALAAAVLAGVGILLGCLAARIRRERRVRGAAERDRQQRWHERIVAYDTTMAQWGSYETDLLRSWQYPLIGDVSDPRCQAFLVAQQAASLAQRDHYPQVPGLVEEFVAATDEMARAWVALEAAAVRIKLAHIPEPFRAKVNLAIELLGKGLHPSATSAERRLFVDRGVREASVALQAMHLRIPERAIRTIEAIDTLALAPAV